MNPELLESLVSGSEETKSGCDSTYAWNAYSEDCVSTESKILDSLSMTEVISSPR